MGEGATGATGTDWGPATGSTAGAARPVVLVVEPSERIRNQLRSAISAPDLRVIAVGSAAEAWSAHGAARPRVALVSLDLPEPSGAAAVELFRQRTGAVVVAVTGQPSIEGAVEAVRRGAIDVLATTDDPVRVRRAVDAAMAAARAAQQEQRSREEARDQYGMGQLLTQSSRMLAVFDQIRMVARTDATALILGETGTGKELVSRAIHDRSKRKDKPFVSVNCGAFTESLLESELFGHEKGSFTGAVGRREGLFEMADGGTLFLDELGETSLNVQVNLLRVLEEMTFRRVGGRDPVKVDVRIIAATNVHLEAAVEEGRFRQDLYWRLSVFPIRLPPLRERAEDIPLLMRHFLDETAQEYGLEPPSVSPDAMAAILAYDWPGNVRQLRAMCERWVIAHSGRRLLVEHLPADMGASVGARREEAGSVVTVDESKTLAENVGRWSEEVERIYLTRLLRRHKGHLGRTAEAAGITRRTLYTKLKQHGLAAAQFRE